MITHHLCFTHKCISIAGQFCGTTAGGCWIHGVHLNATPSLNLLLKRVVLPLMWSRTVKVNIPTRKIRLKDTDSESDDNPTFCDCDVRHNISPEVLIIMQTKSSVLLLSACNYVR